MTAPGSATLIDRVNDEDRAVGLVPRKAALAEGANFRTAHVFVLDHLGRLLLQRLAPERERHPCRWGSSVAAYLFAGETYHDGAARRMADELCLRGPLTRVGKIRMQDEDSTKFVGLFTFRSDHAEICAPDHIAELRYWPIPELDEAITIQSHAFTPTFLELYSFWRGE
jgi:isopentenyl-diphosphate Delta-isomerase